MLASSPFDSHANKVTSKDEADTETFELPFGAAKTPAGTSSSPATAKMGTGIALGGVTGTASGKVYIFEARNAAHCSLTKVSDSSSLAMALFCLAASTAEQAKPFTTGPTLLCRATPPLRSPSSLIRYFTRWSNCPTTGFT